MAASSNRSAIWLLVGLIGGFGLATLWPAQPAQAVATDRSDHFAICTVDVGFNNPEAVFVLDFLTGRLYGGCLNQQSGQFTNRYFRNIAGDFVAEGASGKAGKPKFAIIPGATYMNSATGGTTSTSVIYIAELTSGKVNCYNFQYSRTTERLPVQTINPVSQFSFREKTPD